MTSIRAIDEFISSPAPNYREAVHKEIPKYSAANFTIALSVCRVLGSVRIALNGTP